MGARHPRAGEVPLPVDALHVKVAQEEVVVELVLWQAAVVDPAPELQFCTVDVVVHQVGVVGGNGRVETPNLCNKIIT